MFTLFPHTDKFNKSAGLSHGHMLRTVAGTNDKCLSGLYITLHARGSQRQWHQIDGLH